MSAEHAGQEPFRTELNESLDINDTTSKCNAVALQGSVAVVHDMTRRHYRENEITRNTELNTKHYIATKTELMKKIPPNRNGYGWNHREGIR